MTALFDGVAVLLNDTFGAPVLYAARGETAFQAVQAKLREAPVEVAGGDGNPIVILGPTLHVPRTILPNIKKGDRVAAVATPNKLFSVVSKIPNGSPAVDAMIVCELEEVIT